MALADPQSVTVSGTAIPLPRTGQSLEEGTFRDATGQTTLSVRQQTGRRTRHVVKLTRSLIVSDPLLPATNKNVSHSVHLVVDRPLNGISTADAVALGNALVSWLTSANLTKVIGGES